MAVDADPAGGALSPPGEASSHPDESILEDYEAATGDDTAEVDETSGEARSTMRLAAAGGILTVVALVGLVAFLGVRTYQSHQLNDQRRSFVETGRQVALALTTIDWQNADIDVQRILSSATGSFYDDFAQRSKPFIDVVKQTESTSVGTVTDAGLESYYGNQAKVLVTVSVKTTDRTESQQDPRNWRMRMTVENVDGAEKVSNVEFVQ